MSPAKWAFCMAIQAGSSVVIICKDTSSVKWETTEFISAPEPLTRNGTDAFHVGGAKLSSNEQDEECTRAGIEPAQGTYRVSNLTSGDPQIVRQLLTLNGCFLWV